MPLAQPWEEYVAQVTAIHKGKYQYLNPVLDKDKVEVTCPIHGAFWVRKNNHKSGKGCPACHPTSFLSEGSKTTWEKAQAKHPDYDFSKAVYVSAHTPVLVTCPRHGEFSATPNTLRLAVGCKQCGKENTAAGQRKRRLKEEKT